MRRVFNAVPFVTFAGIGVFALMHGFILTGGLCLFAAFIAGPAVIE